jgi:hypothetical protein
VEKRGKRKEGGEKGDTYRNEVKVVFLAGGRSVGLDLLWTKKLASLSNPFLSLSFFKETGFGSFSGRENEKKVSFV